MVPRLLDIDRNFVGDHVENCRKVRDRLLELNPGHQIFIYWSKVQVPSVDLTDWAEDFFYSQYGRFCYNFQYRYYVFQEGVITWDGSDAEDKLLFTKDNYELVNYEYRFQKKDRKKVDWANWMGQLRQTLGARQHQLYLSSLALPATHNSHALHSNMSMTQESLIRFLNPWVRLATNVVASLATCQDKSVKEQLEMGVRSIDLRVGEGLKLRHGKVELTGHLDDILRVMDDFLVDHPTETIIFQAKWDKEPYSDENRNETARKVQVAVQKWHRVLVRNTPPTLAECEGMMVLYNDNGKGAWSPSGFQFDATAQGGDDRERQFDSVKKVAMQILDHGHIEDPRFCDLWLNAETVSRLAEFGKVITGEAEVTKPRAFADYVNPRFYEFLVSHRRGNQHPTGQKGRMGRVNIDFADYKLVREIVLWNFDGGFL